MTQPPSQTLPGINTPKTDSPANQSYEVGGVRYEFPNSFSEDKVRDILVKQGVIKLPPSTQKQSAPPDPTLRDVVGGELAKFGKGAVETGKNLAQTAIGSPSAAYNLVKMGAGMVTGPLKELTNTDVPWKDRPAMAVLNFFGGDTDKMREYKERGLTGQALAAGFTLPLLNVGFNEVLGGALGDKMPAPPNRANKLSYAIGQSDFDVPATITQVLPELDKTVRTAGRIPTNPKDFLGIVNDTLGREEVEYNSALQSHATEQLDGKAIADQIRSRKRGLEEHPDDVAYNKKIEEIAKKYDQTYSRPTPKPSPILGPDGKPYTAPPTPTKPYTLSWWDAERKNLFEDRKNTAANRLEPRTNADEAALREAEDAIRGAVYDHLGQVEGKPGAFTELKRLQYNLIQIKDRLIKRTIELTNAEAIGKGAPLSQKFRISMYHSLNKVGFTAHPPMGDIVGGVPKGARTSIRKAFTPTPVYGVGKRLAAEAALGRVPQEDKQ